jgi:hypothetical protein
MTKHEVWFTSASVVKESEGRKYVHLPLRTSVIRGKRLDVDFLLPSCGAYDLLPQDLRRVRWN